MTVALLAATNPLIAASYLWWTRHLPTVVTDAMPFNVHRHRVDTYPVSTTRGVDGHAVATPGVDVSTCASIAPPVATPPFTSTSSTSTTASTLVHPITAWTHHVAAVVATWRPWTQWVATALATIITTGWLYLLPYIEATRLVGTHLNGGHGLTTLPALVAWMLSVRAVFWVAAQAPFAILAGFLAATAHANHVATHAHARKPHLLDVIPTTTPTLHQTPTNAHANPAVATHAATAATCTMVDTMDDVATTHAVATTGVHATTVDTVDGVAPPTGTVAMPTAAVHPSTMAVATAPVATNPLAAPPAVERPTQHPSPPALPNTPLEDHAFALAVSADQRQPPAVHHGYHLKSHGVILGATGTGKSTTIRALTTGWMHTWAHLRLPLVLMDLRADPGLLAHAHHLAALTGRACHVITIHPATSTTTYNPLRYGTHHDLAARIVAMLKNQGALAGTGPAEVYAVEAHLVLVTAATALDALVTAKAPHPGGGVWKRTLPHLADLLNVDLLTAYLPFITDPHHTVVRDFVQRLATEPVKASAAHTIRTRLEVLLAGTATTLDDVGEGLDLAASIRNGDIVVFSLDALDNEAAAHAIANLSLADLSSVAARLTQEGWATTSGLRCPVVIDEHSALGASSVKNLLERARAAGLSLWLSAQTPANLLALGEEFFAAAVGNAGTLILHRITADAERIAELFGSVETWETTHRITEHHHGPGGTLGVTHRAQPVASWRGIETFMLHPNILRALGVGHAAIYTAATAHAGRHVPETLMIGTITPTPLPPAPAPAAAPGPLPSAPSPPLSGSVGFTSPPPTTLQGSQHGSGLDTPADHSSRDPSGEPPPPPTLTPPQPASPHPAPLQQAPPQQVPPHPVPPSGQPVPDETRPHYDYR